MKQVALGEVCKLVNGGTPDTKIPRFWDGKHAWITPAEMGNLKNPFLGTSRRTLTDEGLSNSSAQLLPKHSVIMSSRAPIGHLIINEIPMASNQGCKGLIPNENLNYMYLYYFLYANKEYLNELGSGTTFAEISGTKLKNVLIPLPSLEKQRNIVEKLDIAFAEIASLYASNKSLIIHSKELFRAICKSQIELLSPSRYSSLKEMSSLITKGTTPTTFGHKFQENGINFIKVEAIDESGNLIPEKFAYIDGSAHETLLRSQLQENDVLVSITGALGRSALIGLQCLPANVSQNLAIVRLPAESEVTYEFVASLFLTDYFELTEMGAGVAQQALSLAQIGSLQVPILTKKNQTRFIEFIKESKSAIDILCLNLVRQQVLFAELRNAILAISFHKAA
jgi:type I restriction enzyme S subunit